MCSSIRISIFDIFDVYWIADANQWLLNPCFVAPSQREILNQVQSSAPPCWCCGRSSDDYGHRCKEQFRWRNTYKNYKKGTTNTSGKKWKIGENKISWCVNWKMLLPNKMWFAIKFENRNKTWPHNMEQLIRALAISYYAHSHTTARIMIAGFAQYCNQTAIHSDQSLLSSHSLFLPWNRN